MNRPDCLYIVIPCYNEEQVLPVTSGMFLDELNHLIKAGKISSDSRIMFVNDGSSDSTWDIITDLSKKDKHFIGISQSRNRGHQSSVLAGLMEASQYADMTISIDCDGQDDIHTMEDMVDAYHDGCDIVYGVRNDRSTDTFFKRNTAKGFYKIMAGLGAETVYNHADYRLMSRRTLEALSEFEEVNLFLRGIVPQIGFKTSTVEYERKERLAGESKYPLKKMISFAFEGITSFSVKPLKMATTLGIFSLIVCFAMIIYCIVSKATGHAVAGWASIGASIWALGGLQLFMLGVIGEYIGKIYIETKHRPKYIIESIILDREKLEK